MNRYRGVARFAGRVVLLALVACGLALAAPGAALADCECGAVNCQPAQCGGGNCLAACACGCAGACQAGTVCGDATALACRVACNGGCGGHDCRCVAVCLATECDAEPQRTVNCPCGNTLCTPGIGEAKCKDICAKATTTQCGATKQGDLWQGGSRTCGCAGELCPNGTGGLCSPCARSTGSPCGAVKDVCDCGFTRCPGDASTVCDGPFCSVGGHPCEDRDCRTWGCQSYQPCNCGSQCGAAAPAGWNCSAQAIDCVCGCNEAGACGHTGVICASGTCTDTCSGSQ